ncbi:MAG: hypothetical protein ACLR7Z_17905 [Bilophila wadsworthia]
MKNILSLSRMMQFGDSMLPVGAFAFSNGLESAVQKGVVQEPSASSRIRLEQAAKAMPWPSFGRRAASPGSRSDRV